MFQKLNINTGDYNLSFASLLNKRVKEDGAKTAYIYKDIEYTWNDIDKASNNIAIALAKMGVKKGTHVGVCGVNSINWIFTFYAIQKLGGIAVLINPALKPLELVSICEIGDVSVLCYSEIEGVTSFDVYKNECLTSSNIKDVFNFSNSVDFTKADSSCTTLDFPILEADDACLIIYTSGSTGKPKAVLSSAYSIMYAIKPIIDNVNQSKDDINLAFLPFFHVFGLITSVILGPLTGFLSIIPKSKSPSELISLIDIHKVTLFNTVPTMMLAIVSHGDFSPSKLSTIRSSILGGSATSKAQMTMLKKLLPNNHFGNIYGMSENAAISITKYEDTVEHITETVGMPIDGTYILIKDVNGNVLDQGVQGEICIKSGAMLIWYYNLPVDKQPIDSDGYLRTGDLGYIDCDGYIRLTGRIKDLIICGGENISPKEIEEALLSLNIFQDVKVVGIPDEIKGEVVAAAVVTKPGISFDEEKVKNALQDKIAKYKLPVYYQAFSTFPLLSSGKIDKLTIVKQIKESITK